MKPPFVVGVTGGRDFDDLSAVWDRLDEIHRLRKIGLVVAGDASGADFLALSWARANGITYAKFYAAWIGLKKAAGPIRNRVMLWVVKPHMLVAFPGGKGTADATDYAVQLGIPIWRPLAIDPEVEEFSRWFARIERKGQQRLPL